MARKKNPLTHKQYSDLEKNLKRCVRAHLELPIQQMLLECLREAEERTNMDFTSQHSKFSKLITDNLGENGLVPSLAQQIAMDFEEFVIALVKKQTPSKAT